MASAIKDDITTGTSAPRAPVLANRKTSASAKASSFLILQMITLLHPELNGGGDCSNRNAFQPQISNEFCNFDANINSKNYLEDLLKKYNLNNIYV